MSILSISLLAFTLKVACMASHEFGATNKNYVEIRIDTLHTSRSHAWYPQHG